MRTILIVLSGFLAYGLATGAPPVAVQQATGVSGNQAVKPAMNCDTTRALLLVGQQLEVARNLDAVDRKIPLLIRVAQLLWVHQRDNARDVFSLAFREAERRFKEKGDESRLEGRVVVQTTDLRFEVITAISRLDPAWARRLAEQIATDSRKTESKDGAGTKDGAPAMAGKLLSLAGSIAAVDPQTAVGLARGTLTNPPGQGIAFFLYRLADANQVIADQFYLEALNAARDSPLASFLYLSAYPFARDRIVGPDARASSLPVPPGLVGNQPLQQVFLDGLLRRAEASLNSSTQLASGDYGFPEAGQLLVAFSQLAPILPATYIERMASLEPRLAAMLPGEVRQQTTEFIQSLAESSYGNGFERNLERAERESSPDRREQYYAFAVLNAPDSESLDRVLGFLAKIEDPEVRRPLSTYLYFKRTRTAIGSGQLDDGMALAAKVEQLDLRAYLGYEIASASLKELHDRNRARETLDGVEKLALKAASSKERARTLLGVAHLYSKFDSLRAFEVMREAVKTINQLGDPDLSGGYVMQKIEGKTFGFYASYPVEGFTLESAFRPLAPFDFDGALLIAQSFDNKALRATASLALASVCLESAAKDGKPAKEEPAPDSPHAPKKPDGKSGTGRN